MFDKITIRDEIDTDSQVNLGVLCELLLFYGNIHIITDYGKLDKLITTIGPENLIYLLKGKFITISYYSYMIGTHTTTNGPFTYHKFSTFSMSGREERKRRWRQSKIGAEQIEYSLSRLEMPNSLKKSLLTELLTNIEIKADTTFLGIGDSSPVSIAEDALQDDKLLNATAKHSINQFCPKFVIPKNYFFRVFPTESGYLVDSNFEIEKINVAIKKDRGLGAQVTHASILNKFWDAHFDLVLAGHYGSELLTNDQSKLLIELKVRNLFGRVTKDEQQILQFSEFIFREGVAVRDSIQSGDKTFEEFKPILEKASKFRSWIAKLNPDSELLKEYVLEVTKETWADKLPAKTTRFGIFTATGIGLDAFLTGGLATPITTGLGVTDTFLLDRIIKGWRPNHFIDNTLRQFVEINR